MDRVWASLFLYLGWECPGLEAIPGYISSKRIPRYCRIFFSLAIKPTNKTPALLQLGLQPKLSSAAIPPIFCLEETVPVNPRPMHSLRVGSKELQGRRRRRRQRRRQHHQQYGHPLALLLSQYVTTIKDFITLAKYVTSSAKPNIHVPAMLKEVLDRPTLLRRQQRYNAQSQERHKTSAESTDSNCSHPYSLGVLERTQEILRPRMLPDTIDDRLTKKESASRDSSP